MQERRSQAPERSAVSFSTGPRCCFFMVPPPSSPLSKVLALCLPRAQGAGGHLPTKRVVTTITPDNLRTRRKGCCCDLSLHSFIHSTNIFQASPLLCSWHIVLGQRTGEKEVSATSGSGHPGEERGESGNQEHLRDCGGVCVPRFRGGLWRERWGGRRKNSDLMTASRVTG